MSPVTLERIETEAMQLDRADRAVLVEHLLTSLDDDDEIRATWDAEIESRVRAVDAGETQAISADQLFQQIEQRIGAVSPRNSLSENIIQNQSLGWCFLRERTRGG